MRHLNGGLWIQQDKTHEVGTCKAGVRGNRRLTAGAYSVGNDRVELTGGQFARRLLS